MFKPGDKIIAKFNHKSLYNYELIKNNTYTISNIYTSINGITHFKLKQYPQCTMLLRSDNFYNKQEERKLKLEKLKTI